MSTNLTYVSFGEIFSLQRRPLEVDPNKSYAEIGTYSYGKGIFHKEPLLGSQYGDKKLFCVKAGDLILQITFAWEGAVAIASESESGMICSVRYPTYVLKRSDFDPLYVLFYLRSTMGRSALLSISPGRTNRNRVLNLKKVNDLQIPKIPLEEQQHLARTFKQIELEKNDVEQRIKENLELMNAHRFKVLEEIYLGKCPYKTKLSQPELEKYRKSISSGQVSEKHDFSKLLPADWFTTSFPNAGKLKLNLKGVKDFMQMPHVAPNHIEKGTGFLLPYKTIAEDEVKSAKHYFYAGQILFSKIRPNLAKVVEVDFEGLCSADMYPVEPVIDRKYLKYFMLSPIFLRQIVKNDNRRAMPKVNKSQLNKVLVPVAPPDVQNRIGILAEEAVMHWRSARIELERSLEVAKNLLQNTLDQYFSKLTKSKTTQLERPQTASLA